MVVILILIDSLYLQYGGQMPGGPTPGMPGMPGMPPQGMPGGPMGGPMPGPMGGPMGGGPMGGAPPPGGYGSYGGYPGAYGAAPAANDPMWGYFTSIAGQVSVIKHLSLLLHPEYVHFFKITLKCQSSYIFLLWNLIKRLREKPSVSVTACTDCVTGVFGKTFSA